eukprot:Hpha_TRINITY_DN5236_c0_g1::TRINITY_DN5236_c0_g1_i1::g.116706::m.116706
MPGRKQKKAEADPREHKKKKSRGKKIMERGQQQRGGEPTEPTSPARTRRRRRAQHDRTTPEGRQLQSLSLQYQRLKGHGGTPMLHPQLIQEGLRVRPQEGVREGRWGGGGWCAHPVRGNTMRLTLMLSVPTPSESMVGARHLSHSSSQTFCGLQPSLRWDLTKAATSSFSRQSQIPSQACTMNSSDALRSTKVSSGSAVTACASGPSAPACLKSKSPSALLTARSPSTRASEDTLLPLFVMRSVSLGLSGLWSRESGTTPPPVARIERESPEFAQMICSPVINTTLTVVPVAPVWSGFISLTIFSSIAKNAVLIPFSTSSLLAPCSGRLSSTRKCRCLPTKSATRHPPCPSYTPKQAWFGCFGSEATAQCASSLEERQPCMVHEHTRNALVSSVSHVLSEITTSMKDPLVL